MAALAWGAFAFGAVYPWAYWPLAIVCAGLGVRTIIETRAWQDARTRNLAIVLAVIAVAIALQLVSLPYATLQRLSPGVDAFLRQYQFAYHPASLHSLSLSANSTLIALALFVAFSLLLIGLMRAVRYMSLEWLLNQVMGLGVALAVIGIVQRPFLDPGHPLVYGFWKPTQGGSPFGPFINRNHFAGWMLMALPVVFGYACAVLARAEQRSASWIDRVRSSMTVEGSRVFIVGFAAFLMGTSLIVTGSRSGMAAFAVSMVVFGVLAARHTHKRSSRFRVVGLVGVFLMGAFLWAGVDNAVARFSTDHNSASGRLGAWRDTLHIVRDFPVFGTGLGTYAQAMLVYQTADRPRMYAQAHNDYLQILAEGGLLVAVPVVIALGLVLVTLYRRMFISRDDPTTAWVRIGAIAGLAGIAAQSAVEFSLQMPGNRVLFVLLLAIAMHRSRSEKASGRRSAASANVGYADAYRV